MLKPIGDHILVKPSAKEEMTKAGIVLPDNAKEKPQQGEVIAVGQGKYVDGQLISFESMGVKPGVVVMFTKYGPTEVKIDGEEFFILETHDLLGIVEK